MGEIVNVRNKLITNKVITHGSCKIGSVYKTPFRKSDHICSYIVTLSYAVLIMLQDH